MISKRIFYFILIFILCSFSCKAQNKQEGIINPDKVTEINIVNKVYCHTSELKKQNVTVIDRDLINKIIGAINDAKYVSHFDITTNVNYGFFEIEFDEREKAHSYALQYTVYDGVVIRNMKNGGCLKNDLLEIYIYKLFM